MQKYRITLFVLNLFLAGLISDCANPYYRSLPTNQNKLSIIVTNDNWGEGKIVDIQKVLESAGEELWRYFPHHELNPIIIWYDEETPRTLCKKGNNGEFLVQLTAQDRRWAQFAYQFAHEFFHVLSNDEAFCNDTAMVRTQWIEETLAEVSSLFVLRRMAITWNQNPPFTNWMDYAPYFDEYAMEILNEPQHQLPVGKTFREWFRENKNLLRGDPYMRDKNGIIAIRLLPLFERSPESWESIRFLNMGIPDASHSFQSYLNNWHSHVPKKHKKFVEEVSKVFDMYITKH